MPISSSKSARKVDCQIENHGTIFLFRLLTDAARQFVALNVQDDAQFVGSALVVEHRFAWDLAQGMMAQGLQLR